MNGGAFPPLGRHRLQREATERVQRKAGLVVSVTGRKRDQYQSTPNNPTPTPKPKQTRKETQKKKNKPKKTKTQKTNRHHNHPPPTIGWATPKNPNPQPPHTSIIYLFYLSFLCITGSFDLPFDLRFLSHHILIQFNHLVHYPISLSLSRKCLYHLGIFTGVFQCNNEAPRLVSFF